MSTDPPASVLLVDPFPDERQVYGKFLRFKGFDLTVCRHAAMALQLVHRRTFSAIVTRIMQPGGLDGVELTRQLKTDAATAHIPVVVISSQILPNVRREAEAAGCDLFLLLPCLPDRLAAELHALTNRLARRLLRRHPPRHRAGGPVQQQREP